jgi:hypothetical protein
LARELQRLGDMALDAVRNAWAEQPSLSAQKNRVADRLAGAIADFIAQLNRSSMSSESALRLPQFMRVARYYEAATELADEAAVAWQQRVSHAGVHAAWQRWHAEGEAVLAHWALGAGQAMVDLAPFEQAYQELKAELLAAGTQGQLPVAAMDAQLRGASALRRAIEQCAKAQRTLGALPPRP